MEQHSRLSPVCSVFSMYAASANFDFSGPLKQLANAILIVCLLGAIYTHWALKEGIDKMTPAIVFTLLLTCRLVVYYQVRARERRQKLQEEKVKKVK